MATEDAKSVAAIASGAMESVLMGKLTAFILCFRRAMTRMDCIKVHMKTVDGA
jgi:hypothetical protein